jgi:hypothetical protein
MRQLAGYQRLELVDGKGKGNELIHVRNGSGLSFFINVSRGFDIGQCEFHGIPIAWLSSTGPVAPSYYDKEGVEWERSFEGGLLTTCGLTTIGRPSEDQGAAYGLHGRISSTPASLQRCEAQWQGEQYRLEFGGKVADTKALAENVILRRTIRTAMGDNRIELHDVITNETSLPVEHLYMYHINFGYPLVGESMKIHIPAAEQRWIRNSDAALPADRYAAPTPDAQPSVLLHERWHTAPETIEVRLANRVKLGVADATLQITIQYPRAVMPFLTQWRHERSGIRALGIEPGNQTTEGRAHHREQGTLPFLQPWEQKEYRISIQFDLQIMS